MKSKSLFYEFVIDYKKGRGNLYSTAGGLLDFHRPFRKCKNEDHPRSTKNNMTLVFGKNLSFVHASVNSALLPRAWKPLVLISNPGKAIAS